jgi:hypothetical protein
MTMTADMTVELNGTTIMTADPITAGSTITQPARARTTGT